MSTTDAFDGLQVIELATGIAGPVVGMLMADLGAEVVKVELPIGDPDRGTPNFVTFHRGKRSVVMDPNADHDRLLELIVGADLLIVGATAWAEYGLDREDILRVAPRLVVLDLPSYTAAAPGWHGGAESNGLLVALGSIGWRQSSHDGGPIEQLYSHPLYIYGLWAAVCAIAALYERESSGSGQLVTVTGANGVMVTAVNGLTVPADSPDPNTAVGSSGRHPTYTRYQASDGLWFGSGALGRKFEVALLKAIGLTSVLEDPRIDGRTERMMLPDNFDWVRQTIADVFVTEPRDHWLELIESLGIPCGPFGEPEDWIDHPQVDAIGMRIEIDDPEMGPAVIPGFPIRLTATPARIKAGAPKLGEYNAAVSPRAPQAAPVLTKLASGPLNGVRILNSGTFVAGPFSGMLLSELGADVVKVEPLGGDPFRQSGFTFNRGMRSAVVDLTKPDGPSTFLRMAAASDVVIDSLRPGVTTKLGIDHERLSSVRSDIITVSLSGYGEVGALSPLPGVDMILQGMAGLMTAQGGDDEPVTNTIAVVDVAGAVLIALSVVTGLLVRARSGRGQRITTSLAASVTFIQGSELTKYEGRPAGRRGSQDFRGFGPWDRYYQVADGWIRVQTNNEPDLIALAGTGIKVDPLQYTEDPEAALQSAFSELQGHELVALLSDLGVPAVRARRVSEVHRDPSLMAEEFIHVRGSSNDGGYVATGRHASFSRTQRSGPMDVSGAGEHTTAVLAESGLTAEEIDEVVASGAVIVGVPTPQQLAASYR